MFFVVPVRINLDRFYMDSWLLFLNILGEQILTLKLDKGMERGS